MSASDVTVSQGFRVGRTLGEAYAALICESRFFLLAAGSIAALLALITSYVGRSKPAIPGISDLTEVVLSGPEVLWVEIPFWGVFILLWCRKIVADRRDEGLRDIWRWIVARSTGTLVCVVGLHGLSLGLTVFLATGIPIRLLAIVMEPLSSVYLANVGKGVVGLTLLVSLVILFTYARWSISHLAMGSDNILWLSAYIANNLDTDFVGAYRGTGIAKFLYFILPFADDADRIGPRPRMSVPEKFKLFFLIALALCPLVITTVAVWVLILAPLAVLGLFVSPFAQFCAAFCAEILILLAIAVASAAVVSAFKQMSGRGSAVELPVATARGPEPIVTVPPPVLARRPTTGVRVPILGVVFAAYGEVWRLRHEMARLAFPFVLMYGFIQVIVLFLVLDMDGRTPEFYERWDAAKSWALWAIQPVVWTSFAALWMCRIVSPTQREASTLFQNIWKRGVGAAIATGLGSMATALVVTTACVIVMIPFQERTSGHGILALIVGSTIMVALLALFFVFYAWGRSDRTPILCLPARVVTYAYGGDASLRVSFSDRVRLLFCVILAAAPTIVAALVLIWMLGWAMRGKGLASTLMGSLTWGLLVQTVMVVVSAVVASALIFAFNYLAQRQRDMGTAMALESATTRP